MKKIFPALLVLSIICGAKSAVAASTINYISKANKISFTHSADYVNATESKKRLDDLFLNKFCKGYSLKKCKENKDKIIDIEVKKVCGTDQVCIDKNTQDAKAAIEVFTADKNIALSAEDKQYGDTHFKALVGSDSISYKIDDNNTSIATKQNFYKKNKQGVSFYYQEDPRDVCGFKSKRSVCFSVSIVADFPVDDTQDAADKAGALTRARIIKILGPIIATFKFI